MALVFLAANNLLNYLAAFRSFDFARPAEGARTAEGARPAEGARTAEGYLRNVSCALSKISTFYFYKL